MGYASLMVAKRRRSGRSRDNCSDLAVHRHFMESRTLSPAWNYALGARFKEVQSHDSVQASLSISRGAARSDLYEQARGVVARLAVLGCLSHNS